jgi:2-polyprenyl-3-methyl-5-hydroxy-6-metoxy-1,4-benzoquinol methylase
MPSIIETPMVTAQRSEVCRLSAPSHSGRVREAYVALFDEFRKWTPSQKFRDAFHAGVVAEIRRRLATQSKIDILEVGCGHGTWAQEIYRSIDDADARVSYLGIDFTEPRIALARELLAGHAEARFQVADVEHFQPKQPFDLLLCIEVISHVPRNRQRTWLARWHPWLKPDSTAIILDKDRFSRVGLAVAWDAFKHKWLPRRLVSRTHYFPARYGDFVETMVYPSFRKLHRQACQSGFAARPIVQRSEFSVLLMDKKPD